MLFFVCLIRAINESNIFLFDEKWTNELLVQGTLVIFIILFLKISRQIIIKSSSLKLMNLSVIYLIMCNAYCDVKFVLVRSLYRFPFIRNIKFKPEMCDYPNFIVTILQKGIKNVIICHNLSIVKYA